MKSAPADLHLYLVRVGELAAYVQSAAYRRAAHVPISPQRALSQAHNPRAQPGDVALVVARQHSDGELVGYLGLVPDKVHLPASAPAERAGWMSCIWTSPAWRGRGVAQQLLAALYEAWPHRLLITEFTEPARQLYVRSGLFHDLPTVVGLRGYLRPNLADVLPVRYPRLRAFGGLLRLADAALSVPNALRLALHPVRLPRLQVLAVPDQEVEAFVARLNETESTRRGVGELTWLLREPWVLEAPVVPTEEDALAQRYYFTAVARRFRYVAVKLLTDEPVPAVCGFLILSLRDRHLRLPYCYAAPEHLPRVAQVLHTFARRLDAAMVTVLHPPLVEYLRTHRTPYYLTRPYVRRYMVSGAAPGEAAATFRVQDGDGDAAFT